MCPLRGAEAPCFSSSAPPCSFPSATKKRVCPSGAKSRPGYGNACKSWKQKNRDRSVGTSTGPVGYFDFLWGIPIFYGGTPASVLRLITLSSPHLKNEYHCSNERGGETFGRTFEMGMDGLGD